MWEGCAGYGVLTRLGVRRTRHAYHTPPPMLCCDGRSCCLPKWWGHVRERWWQNGGENDGYCDFGVKFSSVDSLFYLPHLARSFLYPSLFPPFSLSSSYHLNLPSPPPPLTHTKCPAVGMRSLSHAPLPPPSKSSGEAKGELGRNLRLANADSRGV